MAQKKPVAAKPAPVEDPTAEIRSKLFNRLAVAGGLVASLLAVLAFFDYLAAPPDEEERMVYTRPVPVPPKKEISQPVTQASNLPEPPAPVPEAESKPATEQPAPPEVAAAPVAPVVAEENKATGEIPRVARVKPLGRSAPDSEAAPRSTAVRTYPMPTQAAAVPSVRSKLPETASDITFPPSVPQAEQRIPSARVVQVQPAPSVVPPSVQRLFSGFLLQAGVFTSQERAEELHARLTLSGVPSTLETRVQVGPFKTRQEAEAAQEKLRELGIGTVLLPPKGSKR